MRKPVAVLEAEDKLAELRTKAQAEPNNTDLAMQVRMADRQLEIVTELAKPRPVSQDAYDAVANTVEIGTRSIERAYSGGAE